MTMSETDSDYRRRRIRHNTYIANKDDPVKSVVQEALNQMCHGRVAFGLRQLIALIGQEDDPDYLGMIEMVDRHMKGKA